MKTISQIILLSLLFVIHSAIAQTPASKLINYQGVLLDNDGNPRANEDISITIQLRFDNESAPPSYAETHDISTNNAGGFELLIGNGTSTSGIYDELPWELASFVTLIIDGETIGTTQMHAVPFALRSDKAISMGLNDLLDVKQNFANLYIGAGAGAQDDFNSEIVTGQNIGIGMNALRSNYAGNTNVAVGNSALEFNDLGDNNTAIGALALQSNDGFNDNVAVGSGVLSLNNGNENTAVGTGAMRNSITADGNSTLGFLALNANQSGDNNTAVGHNAMASNLSGSGNTAVGIGSLETLTTGNNNIGIGNNAQVPNPEGSNQIRMGNDQIELAQLQVSWTTTSDAFWKEDIQPLQVGLNLVRQLKPVDYLRKNQSTPKREMGFIAQDVELLLLKLGLTNQGLLTKAENGRLSLRYNDFIPLLTKAIQELDTEKQNLKQQIQTIEAQNKALKKEMEWLKKEISNIKSKKL